MAVNISGFGLSARIVASNTFPSGFTVRAFADDQDPVDNPELVIAETGMGLNGDMVSWAKATPIDITLNVIAGSEDDDNLTILLDANRVAKGKRGARDAIDMTLIYPDDRIVNLLTGTMISGIAVTPVASAGRYKTKSYKIRFEGVNRAGA